jgi:hypothetical protein
MGKRHRLITGFYHFANQQAQVNLTQVVSLDDTGSDEITDDNTLTPTQSVNLSYTDFGGVTVQNIGYMISGTVATIDPATGIKTVTTENASFNGSGHGEDDEVDSETIAPDASSAPNGTPTETDDGSGTGTWGVTQTVAQTNPDGSAVAPPVTTVTGGTDNLNRHQIILLNGVITITRPGPPIYNTGPTLLGFSPLGAEQKGARTRMTTLHFIQLSLNSIRTNCCWRRPTSSSFIPS